MLYAGLNPLSVGFSERCRGDVTSPCYNGIRMGNGCCAKVVFLDRKLRVKDGGFGNWGYRWGYKLGLHFRGNWGYKTRARAYQVEGWEKSKFGSRI